MNAFRRLVAEAHRRSVWQVLGIYLVGAYIGYQVVLNMIDGFGLPDWVAPFAAVLFVIGLPIVVATAFVQEGPPERADFARGAAEPDTGAHRHAAGHLDPHFAVPGFETAADEIGAVSSGADAAAPGTPAGAPPPTPPSSFAVTPSPSAPTAVERHLTWPKAIAGGIAAFLLLTVATAGYMGMRDAGIGPMGSLVGKGELAERDPIVLAQFVSPGGDSALANAVTEAFRVDFEQSTITRLVEPTQLADALRRMQRDPRAHLDEALAREIAEREGYKAIVTGEVNAVGGGWVLSTRLVSADGRTLASARETAPDSTGILPAIDVLSKTLRERIGESLRSIRGNPSLERVTTASLDALRRYTLAVRVRDEGDPRRAVELMQEATRIDPEFAMAWRKIAAFALGTDDFEVMLHAATRAYELRDRLTARERHLAAAAYHQLVRSDPASAASEYRSVLDLHPGDGTALNNLAGVLLLQDRSEEALTLLERALAEERAAVWLNYSSTLQQLGRTDEARAALDSMRARWPGNAVAERYEAVFAAAADRFAESDSILDRALLATGPDGPYASHLLADRGANAALRGRAREARRWYRDAERVAARRNPAEALRLALRRVEVDAALGGDTASALREIDAALARYPLERMPPAVRPYAPMIAAFDRLGRADRVAGVVRTRDAALSDTDSAFQRLDILFGEAIVRAAAGDAAGAQAVHDEASALGNCDACHLDRVAAAWLARGDTARAIEQYRRFVENRFFDRPVVMDAPSLPDVLVTLAALLEATGDREGAARHYARFVAMWRDADPELQPRVRDAQRRLEAIVAHRG